MSPDDLHERMLAELRQRKAGALRVARHHREKAAEARAAGEQGIARTLGVLAANLEQTAALAEAELRDRSAGHAKAKRAEKNREHASKPRPGRRTLSKVILDAFEPLRRDGTQFKDAMRRWERERLGALRLVDLGGDRYRVTDEDGADDATATYSRGYLEKLYSKAGG